MVNSMLVAAIIAVSGAGSFQWWAWPILFLADMVFYAYHRREIRNEAYKACCVAIAFMDIRGKKEGK